MSYLEAAKRGRDYNSITERKEDIKIREEELQRKEDIQTSLSFEKSHPELVAKFRDFVNKKRFSLIRNEYGELYLDSGQFVLSFYFWATMGDRLTFVD